MFKHWTRLRGAFVAHALVESDAGSMGDLEFAHRCRIAQTDAHASSYMAERVLQAVRQNPLSLLQIRCHAHIIAIAHTFGLAPLPECISALVNAPVSMGAAGVTMHSRNALRQVVRSRLNIRVGRLFLEAELYRQVAIRALVPRGGNFAARQAVLLMLPAVTGGRPMRSKVGCRPRKSNRWIRTRFPTTLQRGLIAALHYKRLRMYRHGRLLGLEEAL